MSLVVFDVQSKKKLFESNPRLLDCCSAIPLENRQSELVRPVDNHISSINGLKLCVCSPGDVSELEEFFNGREYGPDGV